MPCPAGAVRQTFVPATAGAPDQLADLVSRARLTRTVLDRAAEQR